VPQGSGLISTLRFIVGPGLLAAHSAMTRIDGPGTRRRRRTESANATIARAELSSGSKSMRDFTRPISAQTLRRLESAGVEEYFIHGMRLCVCR